MSLDRRPVSTEEEVSVGRRQRRGARVSAQRERADRILMSSPPVGSSRRFRSGATSTGAGWSGGPGSPMSSRCTVSRGSVVSVKTYRVWWSVPAMSKNWYSSSSVPTAAWWNRFVPSERSRTWCRAQRRRRRCWRRTAGPPCARAGRTHPGGRPQPRDGTLGDLVPVGIEVAGDRVEERVLDQVHPGALRGIDRRGEFVGGQHVAVTAGRGRRRGLPVRPEEVTECRPRPRPIWRRLPGMMSWRRGG